MVKKNGMPETECRLVQSYKEKLLAAVCDENDQPQELPPLQKRLFKHKKENIKEKEEKIIFSLILILFYINNPYTWNTTYLYDSGIISGVPV